MRILDRSNIPQIPELKQASGTGKGSRADRGAKAPDRVSLSNEARELQRADAERLEAISRAIADGSYEVDLDTLADAIVRKEQL